MNSLHSLMPMFPLLLAMLACSLSGSSGTPTPISLLASASEASAAETTVPSVASTVEGASPSPTTETAAPAKPEFAVVVIVDTTTEQVTREQAQAAIDEASKFLREFSPYGLVMVDYAQDGNGGSTADMASRVMGTRSAMPPNGLVIFSAGDERQARTTGGYGYSLLMPGFKNAFVSPATGADKLYAAIVDYGYKYMACGYGGSDNVQSTASLPGECRGQTGIACVSHNGYSMCSNAVGNLYTSTPTYAVSSMIVHGLLHNFGPEGDKDHYATAECNARMGYPTGFFDLQESEYYNGLCPFVYEEFTKSYQP